MGKTSLKLNMILEHLKSIGFNYKETPDDALKKYLKRQYRCSTYMANQVIKKLAEE